MARPGIEPGPAEDVHLLSRTAAGPRPAPEATSPRTLTAHRRPRTRVWLQAPQKRGSAASSAMLSGQVVAEDHELEVAQNAAPAELSTVGSASMMANRGSEHRKHLHSCMKEAVVSGRCSLGRAEEMGFQVAGGRARTMLDASMWASISAPSLGTAAPSTVRSGPRCPRHCGRRHTHRHRTRQGFVVMSGAAELAK